MNILVLKNSNVFMAFIPKALNECFKMAGLLTYSLFESLPIRLRRNSGQEFQKVSKSLQQRELFPIFTGFPFQPFPRKGFTGTIFMAKV
jgi:hypothetical protein